MIFKINEILIQGSVAAFKGEKIIRELKEGDSFGESALLYESTRQMTIKARNEVKNSFPTQLLFLYNFIKKVRNFGIAQIHDIRDSW